MPALQQLGSPDKVADFKDDGNASGEFVQLKSINGLSIENLVQYLMNEIRGSHVIEFIRQSIGSKFSIIEHFQNFYRF